MSTGSLEVRITLPCGHELRQRCSTVPGEPFNMDYSAELLDFWLKDRTARHQCPLVSEDNPSGVPPLHGEKK